MGFCFFSVPLCLIDVPGGVLNFYHCVIDAPVKIGKLDLVFLREYLVMTSTFILGFFMLLMLY